ncbi:MAG: Ni/Fe-hydrogenase cytochrome b subunit [Rhodospirillales bacterium]|nr:Ni/Fe-hydrogenase cytochrome b subunit [Rhodospirillales bacterium]
MSAHAHVPLRGRYFTPVTVICAGLVAAMAYWIFIRFTQGLGFVTNLNDGYPWGLWIAYDVVIGTAFACGGYSMALLVYIMNRGEYHPLVRPAILASMFGYSLGGASVLLDLGRWWNMWHIYWPGYAQPNSVMFEVAACISAYIVILWLEFTPAFLERFGLKRIRALLNKVLWVFIALGVLLPSMHQSSLGTLMVVFGHQVHPLWQTNFLPLLYLTSAITMGFCIVIFEATLSSAGFRRPSETPLLAKLSRVVLVLLLAYLAMRFGDLWGSGKLDLLAGTDFKTRLFWGEITLFAFPALILAVPSWRQSARALFIAGIAMLLAGSLYRVDTFLVAYDPGPEWSYFPSAPEMLVTFGIIALEVLAYIVFVRFFPVLHAEVSKG